MLLVLVVAKAVLKAVRTLLHGLERIQDILLAYVDCPCEDILVSLVVFISILNTHNMRQVNFSLTDETR